MPVDSIVFDPDGHPLVGAQFGDYWRLRDNRLSPHFACPSPQQPLDLTSDVEGRIRGTWTFSPSENPLLGLSSDRRLAGFVFPEEDAATHAVRTPQRIILREAVHLRGQLRTASATVPASGGALWWPRPQYPGLLHHLGFDLGDPAFDLPLPPERYQFSVGSAYGGASPRTVVLTVGSKAFDLGPITLQLGAFSLLGEVLPDWHADHAANIDVGKASLADFRGKPLLVCFDEFPDRGRIGAEARNALAKLSKHSRRGDFNVVLFDTSDPPLLPRQEKQPEPVVEKMFPFLSDSTHQTEKLYGSRWAVILLDSDGRLVHCDADVGDAVAALRRLLGE